MSPKSLLYLERPGKFFLTPPKYREKWIPSSRPSKFRSHKLIQISFCCQRFKSLLFCDHFDGYTIILRCIIWIVEGFEVVTFSQKSWNFRTFSEDFYCWVKAIGKPKNSISRNLVASKFCKLRCLWWIMRNMTNSFCCDFILLDSSQKTYSTELRGNKISRDRIFWFPNGFYPKVEVFRQCSKI